MTSYVMILQGGASIVVDAGSLTLSGKVVSLSVMSPSSFSLVCNAGATVVSGVAASLTASQGSSWDIVDSFEGGNPSGWNQSYWSYNPSPSFEDLITSSAGGVPPGGGTNSLLQNYASGTSGPEVLSRSMAGVTEDTILRWDFWMKYHASFIPTDASNPSVPANDKLMRIVGGSSLSQLYFMAIDPWGGDFLVYLQSMSAGNQRLYANLNGGQHFINYGNWEHYKFDIKLASESGAADGYVRGWVDDVQRWSYENIHTWRGGSWGEMHFFDYANKSPDGPNQTRYFDLFKFKIEN